MAGIDHVEEDGRARSRARELILDGGVGWVKLGGDSLGRNVLVVTRETVTREAEGADPDASAQINLAEGVENGAAGLLAGYGLELDERGVGLLLKRSVERADRNNKPRGFLRYVRSRSTGASVMLSNSRLSVDS